MSTSTPDCVPGSPPSICGCLSHNGFLTRAGYAALDVQLSLPYLDRVGSVSASVEVEDDFEYDPNHTELNRRLIHNGS